MAASIAAAGSGGAAAAQAVDGSSRSAFEESIAAMNGPLEGAEAEQFGRGLVSTMLQRYPPAKGVPPMAQMMMLEQAIAAAPGNLDGVTFDEIMSAGSPSPRSEGLAEAEAEAEARRAREYEERRAAEMRARAAMEGQSE